MKMLSRGRAGLTLPEVLLATVIIMIAILGIVGLFPTALQNVQYGGHMSQASSLAQAMIERMRTESFDTVSSYDGLDTRNGPPGGLPTSVLNHFNEWNTGIAPANPVGALPQGWGTIAVSTVAGLPDLLQVTVTVGWQERGNQTISLVTYVARYG
ncbi:MAG: hypothetical protein ACE5K9_00250 [Candidatus Methylomirabilales bacterium]